MTTSTEGQYVTDYISGLDVKAGPEEMEAVQPFSRRLVEEYGYCKDQIQTRPQFRIKSSPSGEEKYPVDIAVFRDSRKTYDNLYMIVECKRKSRVDGEKQLKLYMGLSSAQIGVWFNGLEHLYLQKVLDPQGNVSYQELPNIPKAGQRIEDIGRYRRRDLQKPLNLRSVFRDIRNHLAGMTTGITRDEALARELINVLFCKIYDEINTLLDDPVTFRAGVGESPRDVKARIEKLFEDHVKTEYSDVFDRTDYVSLDADSLVYIVGELQNYCLLDAERDAIGDAFEVFIGPALRGSEGQFFTPRNVIKMIIDILDPEPGESILDPACGSGGFLIVALERVWRKLDKLGADRGWSDAMLSRQKAEYATRYFRGIDKDSFLAKVTKAYMAIVGDGRGGVFCDNSLKPISEWDRRTRDKIDLNSFDVIVTNPPFGSKIQVRGDETLSQYNLGKSWKRTKGTYSWTSTERLKDKQSPQILFIERCIQLLKPGGRLGIILPESIFGNPSHGYIVEYLRERTRILGLVSMPEELFQPYTHAKTCVLFVQKVQQVPTDYSSFMGIVKWCGHNSRGNPIPYDDVPEIAPRYAAFMADHRLPYERFGFIQSLSEIENNILIPKYYNPEIQNELEGLRNTHDLVPIGEFVEQKVLNVTTGVEVGRLSYGTGSIPFIRTSDMANWELKIDPKHGLSQGIYEKYNRRYRVQEFDILVVRDGTYLIGTSCMLTKYDTKILYQSHIYRLRVLRPNTLSPFLLLAMLNTPIVKKQIRAKQFTQDIIDTLGTRISELVLPIPKDEELRRQIERETRDVIEQRAELRQKAWQIALQVTGNGEPTEEEDQLV